MRIISALLVGILFGAVLTFSQMINPAKIIGFLDIAGQWRPSLFVVTGSALVVSFIGYRVVLAREKPVFEPGFQLPTKTAIDRPLLAGSALLGAGWGLSGPCPGPAISGAALGQSEIYVFLQAFFAGMALKDGLARKARSGHAATLELALLWRHKGPL